MIRCPVSTHTAQCIINADVAKQEPDGGVAVGCYPNAGKVVVVDAVLEELSTAVLVNIDAAGEPVMNVTLDNGWVRSGFHLKPSYPVVVDVVVVKVTLQHIKQQQQTEFNIHISIHCILPVCQSHFSISFKFCKQTP